MTPQPHDSHVPPTDAAVRALYLQAQDHVSAGTTARLNRARHAALSAAPAPRRGWTWPLVAGCTALLALAAGLQISAPPASLRSRIVDLQRRRSFRMTWLSDARTSEGDEIDWADGGPDPARQHDGQEAWRHLAASLRALPRRQREAFTLRVLEEFDVETTARIMGCSAGSVKTHLFRAREALQTHLEDFR